MVNKVPRRYQVHQPIVTEVNQQGAVHANIFLLRNPSQLDFTYEIDIDFARDETYAHDHQTKDILENKARAYFSVCYLVPIFAYLRIVGTWIEHMTNIYSVLSFMINPILKLLLAKAYHISQLIDD